MLTRLRTSVSWQFLFIVILIFLMPLTVDINERIRTLRRMRQEEARLNQAVAAAQDEHKALQEQLAYVSSEAYVEEWARIEARMVRPDEVGIVPLWTVQGASASEAGGETEADATLPLSARWHSLFFDIAP